MRRRRLAISILIVLPLLADDARAFSGDEHLDVSNAALRLAIARLRQDAHGPCATKGTPCAEIVAFAEALLPRSDNERHTFGDLTLAVDWFQGPGILTYEAAWQHIDQRRKLTRAVLHGLALHRNRSHFQNEALETYAHFHDQAIVFARRHDRLRAVYSEAVALHFLQDFFAAGHFVTPRAGFADVVAGSLHDKYNVVGVEVDIARPIPPPWNTFLTTEAALPDFKGRKLTISAEDVKAFTVAAGKGFRAGGDECLIQIRDQRVFLVIASAESVSEVLLSASTTPEYIIDVCFEPRYAEVLKSHTAPIPGSRRGPDGGLGVTSTRSGWPRLIGPCEPSEAQPFARYRLEARRMVDRIGVYRANGVEIVAVTGRALRSSDHRKEIDLNWIVLASEPSGSVHVRSDKQDTGDVFRNNLWFAYAAAHISLIKGSYFKALGYGNEYALDLPVLRPFTFSLSGNVRRYAFGDHVGYRFDYGGKVSVGAQVANLTVEIDRGHHVDVNGRMSKEIFIMPGVEISLSNSWLRDVFRRKPATCCKASEAND
jgi:hypothetical protein